MSPEGGARTARLSLLAVVLASASATRGDVVFDASIGSGPGSAPSNSTYAYVIDPGRGEARGGNLFFSFSEFSIGGSDEAGLLGVGFDNVVLRVPDAPAKIDGKLTSEIVDANVFLLAPQGLTFGPNAELDVNASLYLSTANSLVFEDGRFETRGPQPWSNAVCCGGAAVAVHFEGVPEGTGIPLIKFGSTSSSPISPANGHTLFASAGQVYIENSQLTSKLGTIYISATGRAITTVPLVDTDAGWLEDPGVDAEALIEIEGSILTAYPLFGDRGGRVVLRGGELVIKETALIEAAGDYADRPTLEIQATRKLDVSGKSRLTVYDLGEYGTPGIRLQAPEVRLEGGVSVDSRYGSEIEIRAGRLELVDHVLLKTARGGDIDIHAESLDARDRSTITTLPSTSSNAGNIGIRAGVLNLGNGSRIRSSAEGDQNSGDIDISVERALSIAGVAEGNRGQAIPAGILARSGENDRTTQGAAGEIDLDVGSLEVSAGGLVSARSFGPGPAGSISIQTPGDVTVEGSSRGLASEISVRTVHGAAGDITLTARSLSIRDTAALAANSEGSAPAGSIRIDLERDFLLEDARVLAISLDSDQREGGNIEIDALGRIELQDGRIETNVRDGLGSGGNIFIGNAEGPKLAVLNASAVTARAAKGRGGNIQIRADTLLMSADSIIDASSALGIDGSLDVAAPVVQVEGRLDPLPASFLDVRALLRAHCAQRDAEGGSSFVIEEGPPPPPSPRGYLASPSRLPSNAGKEPSEALPSVTWQLAHFDAGCGRDPRLARAP